MARGRPPRRTTDESRTGNVTYLDEALWRQLAEARTADQLCQAWLALQCRMIGGVSAGLVLLERPETESVAPVAAWPRGFEDPQRLATVVERALSERRGIAVRGDEGEPAQAESGPAYQIAYPVAVGRKIHGVAAVELAPRTQTELQSALRQLQWGVAWIQNLVLRRGADVGAREKARVAPALELAGMILEEPSFQGAATVAVTELATRLDCDRVSVGFFQGSQVKVRALSHSAQFGKQMNLIRSIGIAMGEGIDQQAVLVYPEPENGSHQVLRAHEQLARSHGDSAICTVPFVDHEGHAFGAFTFERSAAVVFDEETVELCDSVAALLGPILEEKRKNDRLLVTKARDSLWTQLQRLFGPRHTVRKLVVGTLVVLVAFFAFAKGQYRVTAKTTLEGEVQRVVAAPFRGFIDEAPRRGGDIVREGDLMCSLDVRDLRLEYSRWASEREQYLFEHRRAMAEGDRAAMNVLAKKMRQAEAQIALLDEQISRAKITAPFDGLVVSGDLTQALGAPVEAGEVLFEVAPLESYRLILQVDDRDIGEIREGQAGELILSAMPQIKHPFTVIQVTPVSISEEGRNYFRVEGKLDEVSDRLRPGMEGFGKVHVDRRRLIWIWTHELIDWIRMKTWTWLP
jgi:multidrug resistance efflux pump